MINQIINESNYYKGVSDGLKRAAELLEINNAENGTPGRENESLGADPETEE